jgi:hypothetical protein
VYHCVLFNPAGLRNGDFEEVVEKNATIYGFNAVVLATFAGLAAYNPGFVSTARHC